MEGRQSLRRRGPFHERNGGRGPWNPLGMTGGTSPTRDRLECPAKRGPLRRRCRLDQSARSRKGRDPENTLDTRWNFCGRGRGRPRGANAQQKWPRLSPREHSPPGNACQALDPRNTRTRLQTRFLEPETWRVRQNPRPVARSTPTGSTARRGRRRFVFLMESRTSSAGRDGPRARDRRRRPRRLGRRRPDLRLRRPRPRHRAHGCVDGAVRAGPLQELGLLDHVVPREHGRRQAELRARRPDCPRRHEGRPTRRACGPLHRWRPELRLRDPHHGRRRPREGLRPRPWWREGRRPRLREADRRRFRRQDLFWLEHRCRGPRPLRHRGRRLRPSLLESHQLGMLLRPGPLELLDLGCQVLHLPEPAGLRHLEVGLESPLAGPPPGRGVRQAAVDASRPCSGAGPPRRSGAGQSRSDGPPTTAGAPPRDAPPRWRRSPPPTGTVSTASRAPWRCGRACTARRSRPGCAGGRLPPRRPAPQGVARAPREAPSSEGVAAPRQGRPGSPWRRRPSPHTSPRWTGWLSAPLLARALGAGRACRRAWPRTPAGG